jgi:hypothetical protein
MYNQQNRAFRKSIVLLSVLVMTAVVLPAMAQTSGRAPDLGTCGRLQVSDGSVVAFHAYAMGVQIYRWDGSKWVFVGPSAKLFADAGYHGQIGTHFLDTTLNLPAWESNSGSMVIAMREDGCTPDLTAIPWLLLDAVSTQGPGFLDNVTRVQRVNTVGGLAPATAGSAAGELAQVPYLAEYYFYR